MYSTAYDKNNKNDADDVSCIQTKNNLEHAIKRFWYVHNVMNNLDHTENSDFRIMCPCYWTMIDVKKCVKECMYISILDSTNIKNIVVYIIVLRAELFLWNNILLNKLYSQQPQNTWSVFYYD